MGFLDKAKKLAEQAQTKLDEVQGQFNQQPGAPPSGPATEYDKHGRAIPPGEGAAPSEAVTSAQREAAPAVPAAEAPPAAPPAPPAPGIPAVEEDRNHPSYAPPTLTSGDPLAS
jgi:hypothetical protein